MQKIPKIWEFCPFHTISLSYFRHVFNIFFYYFCFFTRKYIPDPDYYSATRDARGSLTPICVSSFPPYYDEEVQQKQGRIHGTRCAQYAYFSPSKITRDGPTDRRTDGHDLLSRCDGASKNRAGVIGILRHTNKTV